MTCLFAGPGCPQYWHLPLSHSLHMMCPHRYSYLEKGGGGHVEVMLRSCWGHVEVMLRSCWGHVVLWPLHHLSHIFNFTFDKHSRILLWLPIRCLFDPSNGHLWPWPRCSTWYRSWWVPCTCHTIPIGRGCGSCWLVNHYVILAEEEKVKHKEISRKGLENRRFIRISGLQTETTNCKRYMKHDVMDMMELKSS